jgi:hypothetical protein
VGGVNDTADQWLAVSLTPLTKYDTDDQGASKFDVLLQLLMGISLQKIIGKLYYTIPTTFIQKIWGLTRITFVVSRVIDTADHQKVDFIFEYLCKYEAICKKALTHGSGAQIELFDEKKPEVENLVTGTL